MLELKTLKALALYGAGKFEIARQELNEAISKYESRSPFDVKMTARLAEAQIEHALGGSFEATEAAVQPILQTARKKRMTWHLAWALLLRAEALLGVQRGAEGEAGLMEALRIARKNADRTHYWKAYYLLGRVNEQQLRYERALVCYRAAALTIHELAMNIDDARYKTSFLAQRQTRDAVERYERLRAEVGTKARHDLAGLNRS